MFSLGFSVKTEISVKAPKFCQQLNWVSRRSQHPSTDEPCPLLISNAGKTSGSCRSPLQSMERHNQLWTCSCLWNCGQPGRCSIRWSHWEQISLHVGLKLPVVLYSADGGEPVFVTVISADIRLISKKIPQDNWETFQKWWIQFFFGRESYSTSRKHF